MKDKTWERTSVAGLLRHKSGRYYGRLSVAGKDKFVSTKTTLLEIARRRFSEERATHERVRKAVRKSTQGIGTIGDLLAIYRARLQAYADTEMKPARKLRLMQQTRYIERTWPDFAKLEPSEIAPTAFREWRSRALSEGTGKKPQGDKGPETRGKSAFSFNAGLDCVRTLLDIVVDSNVIPSNPLAVKRSGPDRLKANYKPKKEMMIKRLGEQATPEGTAEIQYFEDFASQPADQKGGTVYTVANFLRPYTVPDIAGVFCAIEPNFSLAEVDHGRLICLSIPQTYQTERKYLNLLMKQLFFLHASAFRSRPGAHAAAQHDRPRSG